MWQAQQMDTEQEVIFVEAPAAEALVHAEAHEARRAAAYARANAVINKLEADGERGDWLGEYYAHLFQKYMGAAA